MSKLAVWLQGTILAFHPSCTHRLNALCELDRIGVSGFSFDLIEASINKASYLSSYNLVLRGRHLESQDPVTVVVSKDSKKRKISLQITYTKKRGRGSTEERQNMHSTYRKFSPSIAPKRPGWLTSRDCKVWKYGFVRR